MLRVHCPLARETWNRDRARAKAEPILNAWAEQLLGDPNRVSCKAQYFNADKNPLTDTPDDDAVIDLAALNLCALDIIYAPPMTAEVQQTELVLRLARAAMQQRPATITPEATVRLVFAEQQDGDLAFPELFELARAARELFTNGRTLDARDLAQAGTSDDPGIRSQDISDRLTECRGIWDTAKDELHKWHGLFDVTAQSKLDALKAAPFNVPESVIETQVNLLDLVTATLLLPVIALLTVGLYIPISLGIALLGVGAGRSSQCA